MLAVVLTVPTLWDGGFGDGSRSAFILLSGVLLCAVAFVDLDALVASFRSSLAVTLSALAALTVVSAAWTTGSASAALRAGLVVGGYVAVFAAARVLAGRIGVGQIGVLVGLVAVVEAVLGLRGVALHVLPDAENLEAAWRPGGTYQYPPALALLEVAALPIFGYLLMDQRVIVAAIAGAGAVLAGAVLGLADSRLALGSSTATHARRVTHVSGQPLHGRRATDSAARRPPRYPPRQRLTAGSDSESIPDVPPVRWTRFDSQTTVGCLRRRSGGRKRRRAVALPQLRSGGQCGRILHPWSVAAMGRVGLVADPDAPGRRVIGRR